MNDVPRPPIQGSGGIATSSINFSPSTIVTAPDVTNWHVISDDELTSLSKPEGGILGNIGFAALGAALGAAPSGWTAIDKIAAGQTVSAEAFRSFMVMVPCATLTVICTILFSVDRLRGKGLVTKIKSRPTRSSAQTENH